MPVLDKDKKGSTHRGFFWVYQDSIRKLVIFDYPEGRNKEGPTQMLSSFKGTIQTDGYLTYDSIAEKNGITLIHCMAHAKRYFVDALDNDSERAEYAMDKIQQLYAIEQQCTEQQFTDAHRAAIRMKQSKNILKELGEWMKLQYPQVLPKSPIGQALAYSIKRWEKLSAHADNGIYLPENKRIENSIRPIVLGRKNHLFTESHEAAVRSVMLYSLLGNCKMHGVNPYTWLNDVLSRIAEYPINKIKKILPQN